MQLSIRLKTAVRMMVVLAFAVLCVMAILQPQRWLFLFSKTLTSYVVLFVLFILYGLAGRLK